MKVKPKEIMVNLPIALTFATEDEVGMFAANINTLIHGKVRVKTDVVGTLGGQIVAIFYLQRNDEYSQIREEFCRLIENEEMNIGSPAPITSSKTDDYDPWKIGF
jgi:hypothetical protein